MCFEITRSFILPDLFYVISAEEIKPPQDSCSLEAPTHTLSHGRTQMGLDILVDIMHSGGEAAIFHELPWSNVGSVLC